MVYGKLSWQVTDAELHPHTGQALLRKWRESWLTCICRC